MSNAISHGNKCDSNKNVIFETYEQKDKLTFRVSDEGNGFDPDSVPDPTQPQFCLLYTSDAADERSSVDLGGRRIITKKKREKTRRRKE